MHNLTGGWITGHLRIIDVILVRRAYGSIGQGLYVCTIVRNGLVGVYDLLQEGSVLRE